MIVRAIAVVTLFAVVVSILAVFAGAGVAVLFTVLLTGLAAPLVILAAIHYDEEPVDQLIKRMH